MSSSDHKEVVVCTDIDEEVVCMQSNCRVQASVLSSLRADDKFCDVALFGVPPSGESTSALRPIRGHKIILAYASKHLYQLLCGENFVDSHRVDPSSGLPAYDIENVSHDSLRLIVEFVYTDKLLTEKHCAVDMISHVLIAAMILIMFELADACEAFLAGDAQVNLDNCIFLWCFARKYKCLELMHATSTFIGKHVRKMPENAQFLDMPFADCAKLLMSEAFIAANDDLRCSAGIAWLSYSSSGDRDSNVHDVLNMIPFKPGSMSIDTIIKVGDSQLLRKRASKEMLDLVMGTFKRIKQDLPLLGKTTGFLSSRNWYVVGGIVSPEMFLSYDVDRREWSNLPLLPVGRQCLCACAAANRLIVLGGCKNGTRSADIDEFDLKTKSWTNGNDRLRTNRSFLAVCCDGLYAYAIGGFDGDKSITSVEQYNLQSNENRTLSSMNFALRSPAAVFVPINNSIYVAGGFNYTTVSGIEKYDVSANKWSQVGSLTISRGGLGAALSGEDLYCIGGYGVNGSSKKDVEIYNMRTGQTRAASNLLEGRSGCSATTISDGNVICVLGGNSPTVECYDVRENKWTTGVIVPDMSEKNRYFGFAAV